MPITTPAGMATFLKNQGGSCAPIALLDIQTLDGTQYFWSDYEGTYLSEMTGAQQFYSGWVKTCAPYQLARDLTTNAGSLTLQNLSGNTIDRDVAAALENHEFEGALCVMRLWLPLFDAALREFHCYMSEQNPVEDEASFRLLQLFDPAQYDIAGDVIQQACTRRFKAIDCGSTGSATVCDKLFATCDDAQHNAPERFNGVLTVISTVASAKLPAVPPGGGNRGSSRPIRSLPGNRTIA